MKESIEAKMKRVSIKRLIKLHTMAKEHPFRLNRTGSPKHYGELLDKLGDEFYTLVKKNFLNSNIEFPFRKWIWAHQYWSCVLAIRDNYKHIEEYMVVMEAYLETIHGYYESGEKLNFFYMHVGYSTYDKKQHEENPMRTLKFIYYPELNEYDLTEVHAKNELVYYQRLLEGYKEKNKHYSKSNFERHKKNIEWGIEWYKHRIEWCMERIERLKKILSLSRNSTTPFST